MAKTQTRWLTADEQRTWVAFIRVAVRLPALLDAQLQRDAALGHFDYYVLAALSQAPDRTLRMSDLAASADVTLSHLSRVATRLENRGLLARRPDPDDGRYTLANLTAIGQRTLMAAAPGHVEAVRRTLFDALTPQQARQLGGLCELIQENLWPERNPATAPPALKRDA